MNKSHALFAFANGGGAPAPKAKAKKAAAKKAPAKKTATKKRR